MKNPTPVFLRGEWAPVLAAAALALAARLLYLLFYRHSPFFAHPVIDAETYLQTARAVAAGFYLDDEAFWQPPLYPYWLAALVRLFGDAPLRWHLAQFMLGAINCGLAALLAARVISRPAAWVVGTAMALYGPLIYFDGELLPPALIVFLNLGLLLALVSTRSRPTVTRFAAAGALFGFAALARPDVLLFLPLAVAWSVWSLAPALSLRARLGRAAVLLFFTALCISPATVHNAVVSREFILISSNGGANFYLGNDLNGEARLRVRPGAEWNDLMAGPYWAGAISPSERSQWFYRRAKAEIGRDPVGWAGLLVVKAGRFFRGHEFMRNLDLYREADRSRFLRGLLWERGLAFPFGLVGPLGLLGLALFLGERRPDRLLLVLYVAGQVAAAALFFVAARYRVAAVSVLVAAAAFAVGWIIEQARARRWRRAAGAALAGAALLIASNWGGAEGPEMTEAENWYWVGSAEKSAGHYPAAIELLRQVKALDPTNPAPRLQLGYTYASAGHPEQAAREFEAVLALPGAARLAQAEAHSYLGEWEAARGRTDLALEHFAVAIKLFAPYEKALAGSAQIYLQQSDWAAAEATINDYLSYYPRTPTPWLLLARLRLAQDRGADAAQAYRRAAELNPYDVESRRYLRQMGTSDR